MNPILFTVPLLAAAYLSTARAEEVAPEAPEAIAEEVKEAPIDPMTGKVWDAKTATWLPLRDYMASIDRRATVGQVTQIPFGPPVVLDGLEVLTRRHEAVQRHWQHVFWLKDRGLIEWDAPK